MNVTDTLITPFILPSNDTKDPRVNPTATPITPNIFPSNDGKEPRVKPTDTPIEPHIRSPNNISKPTVLPRAAPTKPCKHIDTIHSPHGGKPLLTKTQPSAEMPSPNAKLVSPNNYENVHVTRIVKRLRGNKYANHDKRRQGVPPGCQHYNRARTRSFLAQSIIKMDDKGYQ